MKIVVITEPDRVPGEIETITALFDAGLHGLHLRKPKYSRQEMEDFLKQIPGKFRRHIIIHSHHTLAVKYKLKGIHLTEKDRKDSLRRLYLKYLLPLRRTSLRCTTSLHKLSELKSKWRSYEYVFFSPVFDSISKEGRKPAYSLRQIEAAIEKTGERVYALGGVTLQKISLCKEVGFKGVGLLGGLWQAEDPVEAYLKIREECKYHTRV